MKRYSSSESFIDSIYNDLINSEEVKKAIERKGIKPKSRQEAIQYYMDRLEFAHSSERKVTLLKTLYYKRYVIDHLPESYVLTQWRIAREQGHGNIRIDEETKEEMLKHIQNEQKKSIDSWLTYLSSEDAMYPMWFKYYAFQGMLRLGKYDKEKGKFTKRSRETVSPYIEVNPEVLGYMYTILSNMINNKMTNEEKEALVNGQSFEKLYTYILNNKIKEITKIDSSDGIWIKYEQGDNYQKLWQSIQGKNTGWCTAGEETCRVQIKNGDFYVYYTKDENEKYTNPRIAIRMNGKSQIAEVRGIHKNQNLEPEMVEIADKKLDEFPDKEKYQKKVHDMKLLTIVEEKTKRQEELTKEEIRFLYEIDSNIEGFGFNKDPRIEEIKSNRNQKKDIAYLFDCKEENVGTDISDFDKKDIVIYIGDLPYQHNKKLNKKFKNLKAIIGDAYFNSLTNAQGLESLQSIGGEAYFKSLNSAQGLESLQSIGGDAVFGNLTSAQGLENLQSIGGYAVFGNLTSARGLENLRSIGGYANFENLTSAQGLESLQNIDGDAVFGNLTSAQGLENLQTIGWNAYFNSLINAQGLESLQHIGWHALFNNLISAQGLENLQSIDGYANFDNLINAQGLENLQTIDGNTDVATYLSQIVSKNRKVIF